MIVTCYVQQPILMSAVWESNRGKSCVARHEWKGLYKMGGRLEDWAEKQRDEAEESRSGTRTQGASTGRAHTMPGSYQEIDSDDTDEED